MFSSGPGLRENLMSTYFYFIIYVMTSCDEFSMDCARHVYWRKFCCGRHFKEYRSDPWSRNVSVLLYITFVTSAFKLKALCWFQRHRYGLIDIIYLIASNGIIIPNYSHEILPAATN